MNMRDEFTGYPLVACERHEAPTGQRSFAVDDVGRLTGVHYPDIWNPDENTARCPRCGPGHRGRCDSPNCGCGFWAYHDGTEYRPDMVQGIVRGYGDVTVGSKGFRAERAEIVALCLPPIPKVPEQISTELPRREKVARVIGDELIFVSMVACLVLVGSEVADLVHGRGSATGHVVGAVIWAAVFAAIVWSYLGRRRNRADQDRWTKKVATDFEHMVATTQIRPEHDETLRARIRANYPDVPFYDTVEAMKADHPVDPEIVPSPSNDAAFWEQTGPVGPRDSMSAGSMMVMAGSGCGMPGCPACNPGPAVAWSSPTMPNMKSVQDAINKTVRDMQNQIQAAAKKSRP